MTEKDDFAELLHAGNLFEAEKYKTILEDHDVPAEIADNGQDDDLNYHDDDLIIQVPRECLEEARHILHQRNTLSKEFSTDYNDFDDPEGYDDDAYDDSGIDNEIDLEDLDQLSDDDDYLSDDDDDYYE